MGYAHPVGGWAQRFQFIMLGTKKKKAYDTWSLVVWVAWVRKAGPEPPVCLGFRIGTREVHNKLEKNRCVCTLGSVTLARPSRTHPPLVPPELLLCLSLPPAAVPSSAG